MGAWGPGLYQDDEALDLKNTISLLSNMPADGDRILEILLANQPEPPTFDRDGGPAFWLVVADQFERRGIRCHLACERARTAIDAGEDLRDLKAREMDDRDLRKRAKVLEALKARLVSPRPLRPRPSGYRKPPMVVSPGEVFAFPSMQGESMNPWSGREPFQIYGGRFEPDGWGVLLILCTGRAYDWFPWCTYSTLSVWSEREPTLAEARDARLSSMSARRGVPRARHLARIGARLLGRLHLADARVERIPITEEAKSPEYVVAVGWSLTGFSTAAPAVDAIRVTELLAD